MKIKLELPSFLWTNRDIEGFEQFTILQITFPTTIQYFKNHNNEYSEFMFTVLGFGVKVIWDKG